MPPNSAGGFAMPPASIGGAPPPAVSQSHAAPPSMGPPPPGGLPAAGPPRPGPQGPMPGGPPAGPPTSQMSAPRGMYPPMPGNGPPMPGGAMPPVSGGPQQPPMPGGMPPMPNMGPAGGHPMPGTQAPPRGGMPPPMGGVHGPSMTQPGGQLPPGGAPPMPGQQPFSRQPQPGLHQPQGPPGGVPGGPFGAANQNNRRTLDPDQMPSPIQVMEEDQRNSNGYFDTREKGQPPPLVTTNFITRDFGNASPRFIRSTMYYVPATEDMRKQTGVPFGIVLSPLAKVAKDEIEPPVTDFGPSGMAQCGNLRNFPSIQILREVNCS